LVLLSIRLNLLAESSDSCEKQSCILKQPSLAEHLVKIKNYEQQNGGAKEQSSSTTKKYETIIMEENWRIWVEWKTDKPIFHTQPSNLSGKPQHIFCTNNFSLSTSKSNRTWRLSLKGFGIVKILENGEKKATRNAQSQG
jgi:hypothetical protein